MKRRRHVPLRLATPEERLKRKRQIEAAYARLNAKNGNVVEALFIEAKAAYAVSRDRLTALDGKAATLIGIVTTGFGVIALLGDPTKTPAKGFWMITALAALAVAFALALASLAPQPTPYPKLSDYNTLELVSNPANEARLKLELTEAFLRDMIENSNRGYEKSRLLLFAIGALTVALLALAANYIGSGEKPTPSVRVIFSTPQP